jgi:hypothetical protein
LVEERGELPDEHGKPRQHRLKLLSTERFDKELTALRFAARLDRSCVVCLIKPALVGQHCVPAAACASARFRLLELQAGKSALRWRACAVLNFDSSNVIGVSRAENTSAALRTRAPATAASPSSQPLSAQQTATAASAGAAR